MQMMEIKMEKTRFSLREIDSRLERSTAIIRPMGTHQMTYMVWLRRNGMSHTEE
jgi:hypothetical protein